MGRRGCRRTTAAVVAVLAAVVLAGCDDGSSEPQRSSTPVAETPASSAPPAPTGDPAIGGQAEVLDPLPTGKAVPVLQVPVPKRARGYVETRAAFTTDAVVYNDTYGVLHALDRATGAERWKARMSSSLQSDTMCRIVSPSVEATRIVVNHGVGDSCGLFTVYDLATGKVVDDYDSVSEAGRSIGFLLPRNTELVTLGEDTYWVDSDSRLRMLQDDGSSSVVGNLKLLDPRWADYDGYVATLQRLPASDVMMVRMVPHSESDEDFGKVGDRGFLAGFRVEDGRAVLVWKQDVSELVAAGAAPGHKAGSFGLADEMSDAASGLVWDSMRVRGKGFVRVRAIDPETGVLANPGVVTPVDGLDRGGPGVPSLVTAFGDRSVLQAGDGMLFSPYEVPRWPGKTSVVRYDTATGEPVWRWRVPGAMEAISPHLRVLAVSADRASVYVTTDFASRTTLWEIGVETGKPVRSWVLDGPGEYPHDMVAGGATTYVEGDTVFQLAQTIYPGATFQAGLLRLTS